MEANMIIDVCTRIDTKSPIVIRNGIYSYAMGNNTKGLDFSLLRAHNAFGKNKFLIEL
jgi:hypothetical protein